MIEIELKGKIEVPIELTGHVDIMEQVPVYNGEYTVIPKSLVQELTTKGKKMKDNVTVEKIPYSETHNKHGMTISIGAMNNEH